MTDRAVATAGHDRASRRLTAADRLSPKGFAGTTNRRPLELGSRQVRHIEVFVIFLPGHTSYSGHTSYYGWVNLFSISTIVLDAAQLVFRLS